MRGIRESPNDESGNNNEFRKYSLTRAVVLIKSDVILPSCLIASSYYRWRPISSDENLRDWNEWMVGFLVTGSFFSTTRRILKNF